MPALVFSITIHGLFALFLYMLAPTQHPRTADPIAVGLAPRGAASGTTPPRPARGNHKSTDDAAAPLQQEATEAAEGSGADADGAKALSLYIREVHSRLAALKSYPPAARSLGQQGVTEISFTIDAQGHARGAAVTRSSAHPILDQSALALLEKASPFPPLPPALGPGPISLTLPIAFSLDR